MGNSASGELKLNASNFVRELAKAGQELRSLENQFKSGTASLDDWEKSSTGLEQRQEMLTKSIEVQTRKVQTLKDEYDKVAEAKGKDSIEATKLEADYFKATTTLGKFEKELADIPAKLKEVGDETKKTGDESKKSEKEVKTLGDSLKDLGKGTASVLAGVGKAVAAVGAAAVGAVTGLTAMVMKSAETAGGLVDLSAQTGLTITQIQELDYAGTLLGLDVETITKSMSKFTNVIEGAASGVGPMAEDMATLGVSVTDSNGALRDSNDVYFEALNALGQLENETQKEIIAQNLFGKSYQELIPLINTSAEEMDALKTEAHSLGAVMEEDAVRGLESFGDEVDALKMSAEGMMGTISAAMLPTFQGMTVMAKGWMGKLAGILSGSDGDMTKIGPQLGDLLGTIFADLAGKAPGMVELGLGLIEGLLSALLLAMPNIIPAAIGIVVSLIEGISSMAGMLLEVAPDLIMQLVNGLVDALPEIVKSGTEVVLALVAGIGELLPKLIPAAVEMIVTIITGIADAMPQLMVMIAKIIPEVVITLINNLPLLIGAALELIVALVDGLVQALPVLISYVPEIILAIVGAIVQSLPSIISSGTQIIESLISGISGMFTTLKTSGSDAITKVLDGVKSMFSTLYTSGSDLISNVIDGVKNSFSGLWDLGRDIVLGIWEGIKAKWEDLKTWVGDLFKNLIRGAQEDNEIESPSRLWARRIGGPIAEGIGVGFLQEMDNVERSMRKTMAGLLPTMDVGISAMGMQPVFAGVGQTVTAERPPVTINVNPSEPIDYELLANKVARKVTEGW